MRHTDENRSQILTEPEVGSGRTGELDELVDQVVEDVRREYPIRVRAVEFVNSVDGRRWVGAMRVVHDGALPLGFADEMPLTAAALDELPEDESPALLLAGKLREWARQIESGGVLTAADFPQEPKSAEATVGGASDSEGGEL